MGAYEDDEEDGEDLDDVCEADQIKEEIDRIEKQIAKVGGLQSCGWDPADHKDFLRIKTKHKDRVKTVAFMNEMRRAVPTIDEEGIQEHVETFLKIQAQVEKKKELMKKYKEAK